MSEDNKLCKILNCTEKVKCKNLCSNHYSQYWQKLNPEKTKAIRANYKLNNPEKVKSNDKKQSQTARYKTQAKEYQKSLKGRLGWARRGAKIRNINFDLTEIELGAIIKDNRCNYCKGPLNNCGGGVDRIDTNPSVGYIASNLSPCCGKCNKLRNNLLTTEETVEVVKLLQRLRNKKDIWNV